MTIRVVEPEKIQTSIDQLTPGEVVLWGDEPHLVAIGYESEIWLVNLENGRAIELSFKEQQTAMVTPCDASMTLWPSIDNGRQ